jgi:AcrR family transcriptional regulator
VPRPSQRDRILDAYTDLVVELGPGAVTVEGVAARAGVSKGGLLYHFGSKDALLDGLLERTTQRNDADLATAREAPEGLAHYYLRTSVSDAADGEGVHHAMVALYTLSSGEPRAAEATRRCMRAWEEALAADLGDALTARLVAVVGDGLYLRAMVGDPGDELADPDVLLGALRSAR